MFTIVRNTRTGLYEIHTAECKHSNFRHIEVMGPVEGVEGTTGDAIAENEARHNEGCAFTTGPCVQPTGRTVHYRDEEQGWAMTSTPLASWGK